MVGLEIRLFVLTVFVQFRLRSESEVRRFGLVGALRPLQPQEPAQGT